MSDTTKNGLIILGNSGVGKSFLANILIGRDTFFHQFTATSVTHSTQSADVTIGLHTYTIFDIPGLIEAEQERIHLNKQEIDKAFKQKPNSIIIFVFGQKNGRILSQDVVAFNAINTAYPFRLESLVLVVNKVPKNRPNDYEEETFSLLQTLLQNMNISKHALCFTDLIDVNDSNEKQVLQNRLSSVLIKFVPQIHHKKQDVQTLMSELKKSETVVQEQQAKLVADREMFERQLKEQKRIEEQELAENQRRIEQLRLKDQQRQAMIAEQQRQMEVQRAAQEAELKRLRDLTHHHHHPCGPPHHHHPHHHPHPHGHHPHPPPPGHHPHHRPPPPGHHPHHRPLPPGGPGPHHRHPPPFHHRHP